MVSILKKVFGDTDAKAINTLGPLVAEINSLEPEFQSMSDEEFRDFAVECRQRMEAGETTDDLLPEVFAATREFARRVLGQRHYDVQLMGGIVLHRGKIAEMRTGEGKTQTATLAVALNAMEGHGVHLVTINDYLARRDTAWMGRIYHALGLSTASIQHDEAYLFDPEWESPDPRLAFLRPISRSEAYAADITYGTNNEFGFDYLRDNMVVRAEDQVQRGLAYAIVDEVDNILIDEARTPLIISGQAAQATDRYYQFAQVVRQLRPTRHYEIDLKSRTASLSEDGIDRVESLVPDIHEGESIYDERHTELTHHLEQALKAQAVFHRDKDYVVTEDGEVVIVDEFTGRLMPGRRYSEGLHQAIEAKENVRVRRQNVTMATITFQNYFRMYGKLAGMTGTAKTEAEEFIRIYNLDVVPIPTNRDMIRDDAPDYVFKNESGKFSAVVDEIERMHADGRPVLVGTVSIEKSELLSDLLQRRGIPHQVLNAKQHEREAAIVAEAGLRGAVTIATNMAGRGTDIVLGPGVVELGGLHILGTERHEARRIDNQLRGRAGRQGDPGSSRFFVSLEDELMRRFGSERIVGLMERLGMEDDTPIEHRVISKSIESAQTKVEGHNFDLRKHVVQYDDVMNKHREVIYGDRQLVVSGAAASPSPDGDIGSEDAETDDVDESFLDQEAAGDLAPTGSVAERVQGFITGEVESLVDRFLPDAKGREAVSDLAGLHTAYIALVPQSSLTEAALAETHDDELADRLFDDAMAAYAEVEARFGSDTMRTVERHVMLSVIDRLWVEHLTAMDELREGVGLQAYGQRDPLIVYKTEGFRYFQSLLAHIQHDVVHTLYRVKPAIAEQPVQTRITAEALTTNREGEENTPVRRRKVGANEPCWCGSGKKFKRCHGAVAAKATA
ncbi:MAG: preprotein translocase subunit SecA [Chloroflexia bacterium]|nr:preprotein translocase subunit SecA [Chloroflexia bacterium]